MYIIGFKIRLLVLPSTSPNLVSVSLCAVIYFELSMCWHSTCERMRGGREVA